MEAWWSMVYMICTDALQELIHTDHLPDLNASSPFLVFQFVILVTNQASGYSPNQYVCAIMLVMSTGLQEKVPVSQTILSADLFRYSLLLFLAPKQPFLLPPSCQKCKEMLHVVSPKGPGAKTAEADSSLFPVLEKTKAKYQEAGQGPLYSVFYHCATV